MAYNILVTGGRGYIGSALCYCLRQAPYIGKIVVYDIIDGNDICDVPNLVKHIFDNNIGIIIHLAAISDVASCTNNPKLAIQTNAIGTKCVLDAMTITGCQNIIYASTSSVYGNNRELPYFENHSLKPQSCYGYSKLLGEHCIFNHYNVNLHPGSYYIFRMFNVVGTIGVNAIDNSANPGYDRLFATLQQGKLTIYGNDYFTTDGTCERDYVSLKDTCNAYLCAIKNIYLSNQRMVLNISTNTATSVAKIVRTWNYIADQISNGNPEYADCHPLPHITPTFGPRRLGDPAQSYGLNTLAYSFIDWDPLYSVFDIIVDIARHKDILKDR